MRTKKSKNKMVAYGYVGRWNDGTLGWMCPEFIGGGCDRGKSLRYRERCKNVGREQLKKEKGRFVLCKITLQALMKNGKPVTRSMLQLFGKGLAP